MATRSYNLPDFLENPTRCCFFPEATAGPDLVVALEDHGSISRQKRQKGFVFFQFKLREKVTQVKALRTTEWKSFYCDRSKGKVLSAYEGRAARVKTAMQDTRAFCVAIAFPYEAQKRLKRRDFRWCGEKELRGIFGDGLVDFLSALKTAQTRDFAITEGWEEEQKNT
jgi:hypothetical protein